MFKTIIGVFQDSDEASNAIYQLKEKGFDPKDISVVMRDRKEAEELKSSTGITDTTVTGATTGAAVGGLLGLLVGIGTLTIPGAGAFLFAGPIAAALGLTGAAAATVTGATTGALAGGVLGALAGLGVSEDDAAIYEERIRQGGILIAVPALSENDDEVIDILQDNHANQVRSITHLSSDKEVSDSYRSEYDSYNHSYAIGAKGGRSKKKK